MIHTPMREQYQHVRHTVTREALGKVGSVVCNRVGFDLESYYFSGTPPAFGLKCGLPIQYMCKYLLSNSSAYRCLGG